MSEALTILPREVAGTAPPVARVKLEELQVLRAVAAGMVVWAHAQDWAPAAGATGEFAAGARAIGAAGVDLFFIISGFIIARSAFHATRRPGAGEFMMRRLLRIVPLYWFWSAVVFAWQSLRGDGFTLEQVVKTLSFFPWAETNGYVLPVLYLGWTLSFELLFYLAISVALGAGVKRPWSLIAIGLGLAAVSVVATSGIAWIPFLATPLWLEFAAGMLLAAHYDKIRALPRWSGAVFLGAGLIWWLAAVHWAPLELASVEATLDNTFSRARVFWWGGGAVCLALGTMVMAGGRGEARWPKFAVRLGDASYTWYLTQAVTLPVAAKLWWLMGASISLWVFCLFAVALTGAMAVALAHAIEFPLQRWSMDWVRRHGRRRHESFAH